jgi:hypothetical protein
LKVELPFKNNALQRLKKKKRRREESYILFQGHSIACKQAKKTLRPPMPHRGAVDTNMLSPCSKRQAPWFQASKTF